MQTPTKNNIAGYSIGRQVDLAIGLGPTATVATQWYAVKDLSPQNNPKVVKIEDAEGSRTTNSYNVVGVLEHPWSFSGSCDVNKLGLWIYLCAGVETVVQDGATGAYKHTFSMLNNVILPRFTMFVQAGAEGNKRLINCAVTKLAFSVKDSDATFTVEGLATGEDSILNSSTSVSSLICTSMLYQSGSIALQGSIMRATFSGSPNLASVKVGDMFVVPSNATGITNAVNKGNFQIIAIDNTAKTIDYINNTIYDNTKNETTITSSALSIANLATPTYPTPISFLLRRHSAVYQAANQAGLATATMVGLASFDIEINNNSDYLYEKAESPDPVEILAHNISASAKFTQTMSYNTAQNAQLSRTLSANNNAFQFEMQDTNVNLGSSITYHPLLQIILPVALGVGTRKNFGSKDTVTYDWDLNVAEEQSIQIVLQNTTPSYVF